MSHMENNVLTNLVRSAEAVGYSLPAELLDAHRTYVRVKAVEISKPKTLEAEDARSGYRRRPRRVCCCSW
jgi:hypothetical protein